MGPGQTSSTHVPTVLVVPADRKSMVKKASLCSLEALTGNRWPSDQEAE